MTTSHLDFSNVSFHYRNGPPVLDNITFQVAAGEAVGLFGPNGAGKTTLTRLAMALLHPTTGTVTTLGTLTTGRHPEDLAGRVGYLFQHPEAQLFARTVEAEVAFGLEQMGVGREEGRSRTATVLERVGLLGSRLENPWDLPAPHRRLVAMATVLVTEPSLLILDEPTAGLDLRSRDLVHQLLREHLGMGGSVLAVTHDPVFAAETLDRGMVLGGGKVIQELPVSRLLSLSGTPGIPRHPLSDIVVGLDLGETEWRRDRLAHRLATERA